MTETHGIIPTSTPPTPAPAPTPTPAPAPQIFDNLPITSDGLKYADIEILEIQINNPQQIDPVLGEVKDTKILDIYPFILIETIKHR